MSLIDRIDAERKPVADAQPNPKRALAVVPDKKAEPEREPEADFKWNADNDSIILREQPATAVYFNKEGSLVIRQQGSYPEGDVFIYIVEANLDNFLDKITDICGIPSVGKSR